MYAIVRVSMDVLWPHYGIGMYQAAALLLVPDIPLTDKNSKKKFTTYFYQYFTAYNLNFTLHFTKMWCLE